MCSLNGHEELAVLIVLNRDTKMCVRPLSYIIVVALVFLIFEEIKFLIFVVNESLF